MTNLSKDVRIAKLLNLKIDSNGSNSITIANRILNVIACGKFEMLQFKSEQEKIETMQWLPISCNLKSSELSNLENFLSLKSYLVGNKCSLADIFMFDSVSLLLSSNEGQNNKYPNIYRWLSLISFKVGHEHYIRMYNAPKSPTLVPAIQFNLDNSSSNSSDKIKLDKIHDAAAETKPRAKKTETQKNVSTTTITTTVTVEEETTETLDPSKLDIRVGLVVKCWDHPDSVKLLCEEIDIGEGSNRSIASGLRAHYKAEELQGRKVLVLANLKERPMAGFKSQV
jgi:methionine--tRNA ligase beta chain